MEAKAITYIATALTATHDMRLVVFSIAIAVVGSYTALELAGQVSLAQGRARRLWLVGGAIALGISIWAMHFIAMLAYSLPIRVTYDFSFVLLSIAVAIGSSGVGLFVVTRLPMSRLMLLAGGFFVGFGIIGMHFTAMASMRMAAVPLYNLKLVVLSDAIAVGSSFCALCLAFRPSSRATVPVESLRKIGSAVLAGIAISGMHYIAMAAVSFHPSLGLAAMTSAAMENSVLAFAIGVAALIIVVLALIASFFGQRLSAEIARAEALRESEERYQNLYDFAPDAYFTIAADGKLLSVNQYGAECLGYRKAELINSSFWNIIYEADREWLQQQVERIFNEHIITSEIELRKVRKDGLVIWERQRSQLLFDASGKPIKLHISCRDITQRKIAEDALRQNAFHDALTGLPNRALFMDRLEQAVEYAKRHEDYLFAVLFLDLDRFKVVNDSLGHLLGDQLLIGIAQRLKTCLRPTDTVARFGGDEFTILLEDIRDVGDAIGVANRVQEELTLPFDLSGQEVFTSASIGIALSAIAYDQPEYLLRDADIAMYRAKSQGLGRYEIFNPDMHARAVALLQLETDLRNAIERQEFRLQYQPIVSLETGRIIGFEALLRWHHPLYGQQIPVEFITAAEETGLLARIGQWVMGVACSQVSEWRLQFPTASPLIISVNISGQQFTQLNLIEQINQILHETRLDAASLRLEITEGTIMQGAESATAMLLQLRKLGVQLSIDDFGTGFSSLDRLRHFPIDGLKIDRSFVSGMGIAQGDLEIVEAIVTLAHKLDLDVTAEGVETKEQLAQLRALKCEYGQGYFFSRPLDSEQAAALIASNPQW